MKRITALVTIVTVLSLMLTAFVFADDTTDVPQWFRDMISWKKAQIEQAEQAGSITKEQAELYKRPNGKISFRRWLYKCHRLWSLRWNPRWC